MEECYTPGGYVYYEEKKIGKSESEKAGKPENGTVSGKPISLHVEHVYYQHPNLAVPEKLMEGDPMTEFPNDKLFKFLLVMLVSDSLGLLMLPAPL